MGASRKEIAVIEAWTRPSVIPIACSLMLMSSEFDDEDDEDEEEEEDDDDDEEPSSAISSDVSITIWMMEDVPHTRFKAVWRSRTVFQRRNDMVSQTVLSRSHGGREVRTATRSIRQGLGCRTTFDKEFFLTR